MKRTALAIGFVILATTHGSSEVTAQRAALNPVGSYDIATTDDAGMPLQGVLTVRASGDGYVGQFVAPDGSEIPMLQVTSNGGHLMAMFDTGDTLAVTWLQRQEDGSFTGTWHEVGPGLNVKATKKSGSEIR